MKKHKLYQQVLLDHNKRPRNFMVLTDYTHHAHGVNPLCGDDYHIFLKVVDGVVNKVGFHGQGCAISKSVASMMTQHILNQPVDKVLGIKDVFIDMVTHALTDDDARHLLGHLTLFETVKEFPIRVKCATLIWRALEAALSKADASVSTE